MIDDIIDIEIVFRKIQQALLAENEEEWDKIIYDTSQRETKQDSDSLIHIRVCGELIIDRNSTRRYSIEFLVASYDNANIRITIDASRNHGRAHIHIGIKQDKYRSASIALDDGTILNNTGNIAEWKVKKIADWVRSNRQILEKIYRCINPWGDSESAEKRKNKLSDIN